MSSSQNRATDKHIIWSDINLNPNDWRDNYRDFLEINEIDGDPNDEHKLYEYMVETNGEYLSDERENLNVQLQMCIRDRSSFLSRLSLSATSADGTAE